MGTGVGGGDVEYVALICRCLVKGCQSQISMIPIVYSVIKITMIEEMSQMTQHENVTKCGSRKAVHNNQ